MTTRCHGPLAVSALLFGAFVLSQDSFASLQDKGAGREPAWVPQEVAQFARSARKAGLQGAYGAGFDATMEQALVAEHESGRRAVEVPGVQEDELKSWDRSEWVPRPDQVAVRYEAGMEPEDMIAMARAAGVPLAEVADPVRPGWTFVTIAPGALEAAREDGSLEAFARMEGIRMVAPVLQGADGWITPSDEILMKVPGAAPETLEELFGGREGVTVVEQDFAGLEDVLLVRCERWDGEDVLGLVEALAAHPAVAWAEPNALTQAVLDHIPNDPSFGQQWGLHNTGQSGGDPDMEMFLPAAWDVTFGNASIEVLVLDTGSDFNHPDLNEAASQNFTGVLMGSCEGHGTNVAGCISAKIDNNLHVAGVAPSCRVLSARVIVEPCVGTTSIQTSDVANALAWGGSMGAEVSNSSFKRPYSSTLATAYSNQRAAGMSHFAAAGNDNMSGSHFPGDLTSVQEVGAIDRFGDRANFGGGFASHWGPDLIFAPGKEILTLDRLGSVGSSGGDTVLTQGTSFASPYTAAVAALVRTVYPAASPAEVEDILRSTTTDLGGVGTQFGYGLVNAEAAVLDALQRQACTPAGIPYPSYEFGSSAVGRLNIYSPTTSCSAASQIIINNVPANTDIYLFTSLDLAPTPNPLGPSGMVMSPNASTLGTLPSDFMGRACLGNVGTCFSIPLFVQAAWIIPGTTTLQLSNVIMIDPEASTPYQVGPGQAFARIGDAVFATLNRRANAPAPIDVHSGTYDEHVYITGAVDIREAAGATAVLRSTTTLGAIVHMDLSNDTTQYTNWTGIDIIAAGSYPGPVIDVDLNGNGAHFVAFEDMSFSDEAGVVGNTGPVVRSRGLSNGNLYMSLRDVDVDVQNYAWGPLLRGEGSARYSFFAVATGASVRPAGSLRSIVTTCSSVASLDTQPNIGLSMYDTTVDFLNPRAEMFDVERGTAKVERCLLRANALLQGISIHGAEGLLDLHMTVVEAQQGSARPIFDLGDSGEGSLGMHSSALVFDATATAGNAAVRAHHGGVLNLRQSTIRSTTSHVLATAIDGPGITSGPTVAEASLTGTVDGNVFMLPGSDTGVLRAHVGTVALEHQAENMRHCPGGLPSERDQLPGRKLDEDPMLVPAGYKLSASSNHSRRRRSTPSIDIDGETRYNIGSPFGCDHVAPPAQVGRHVGAGYAHTTIQSAINAASPGETIIVHNGFYFERIVWSKPVNIVEAWGESAVLQPIGGASQSLIHQTQWSSPIVGLWEGIDVVNSAPSQSDVIRIDGAAGGLGGVQFVGVRFFDLTNPTPGMTFFRVNGVSNYLTLDGCRVDPIYNNYDAGFRADQTAYIWVKDSYVTFGGNHTAFMAGGGQITFDGSLIEDRGTTIGWAEGNQSSVTFYRSVVRASSSPVTFSVGRTGAGAASIAAIRSVIDIPGNLWRPAFEMTVDGNSTIFFSNSGFNYLSTAAQGNCLVDAQLGGNVVMQGCTVHDVLDEPQYAQFATIINGPAYANATLNGSLNFNVFDIPGTTRGVIRRNDDTFGNPFGTVNVVLGTNVVNATGGSLLFDRANYPAGQPTLLDPVLGMDGVHRTTQSPTTPMQSSGSGLGDDLEGQSRGSVSFIGADGVN